MTAIGDQVEETGTLLRDGGGFLLKSDKGGTWRLNLHRVPVDHVAKQVRVVGVVAAQGQLDVEGLRLA